MTKANLIKWYKVVKPKENIHNSEALRVIEERHPEVLEVEKPKEVIVKEVAKVGKKSKG